jgi:RHS repeat-associated protein
LGRRVSIADGTTTNYLVYSGTHVVAEVDVAGNVKKSYTHGPGVDNILAMTVYGGTTNTYYYLKDHLGSVVAAADSAGRIVEQYRFDAWGRVIAYDDSGAPIEQSAIANHYLFQGREYSWKTGLYYFRARWYDPVTGRWLSKDPIGITGGLNQYVAFGNNPVGGKDPYGLWNLWNPATWGNRNGIGYRWYDSLNPLHESAVWAAAGWGASEGASAALDGIIPFFDPFEIAYADECGNVSGEYKASRFIGGTTVFIELSLIAPAYAGAKLLSASGVSASVGTQWVVGSYYGVAGIANTGLRMAAGLFETGITAAEAYSVIESARDIFRK